MKQILLIFLTGLLFQSCRNNSADATSEEIDSTDLAGTSMVWQAGLNDSTGRLDMKHVSVGEPGLADAPSLIEYINRNNPNIIVSYIKSSNDTVYLKIDDAEYLTQRMGSSGAMTYLAGVIYNLTDLPGIRYVNLDFEEGDHASPGTFTKETFRND